MDLIENDKNETANRDSMFGTDELENERIDDNHSFEKDLLEKVEDKCSEELISTSILNDTSLLEFSAKSKINLDDNHSFEKDLLEKVEDKCSEELISTSILNDTSLLEFSAKSKINLEDGNHSFEKDLLEKVEDKCSEELISTSILNDTSLLEFSAKSKINLEDDNHSFEKDLLEKVEDKCSEELISTSILNDISLLEFSSESKINLEDECKIFSHLDNYLNKSRSLNQLTDIIGDSLDDFSLNKRSREELVNVIKGSIEKNNSLQEKHDDLEKKLEILKTEYSSNSYEAKIKVLENELSKSKDEYMLIENKMRENYESFAKENIALKEALTSRMEKILKNYEAANKEKESMVIKYAMAEKEVIVVKKQKENLDKKLKELEKNKEILQTKVKTLLSEKEKLGHTLDHKVYEHGITLRNLDKMKDELNAKDIKIKWGQNKLKTEIDEHKETKEKLDKTLARLFNHEDEMKRVKVGAENTVKDMKESEHSRSNILDKQLTETKANLIMEKQKYEDVSTVYKQLKNEHDNLCSSHILLETEATTLRVKVSKYESERVESEKLFESLQTELKTTKQEAADLQQQLANASGYSEQLESEKLRANAAEQDAAEMKNIFYEQNVEMEKCREKEAELLTFTQKLTDKNITLQSQLTSLEGKVRLLDLEHKEMKSELETLKGERLNISKELSILETEKKTEQERLQNILEVKNNEVTSLETKVSDLINEIQVQQKKHLNSTKDTNREILKLRKKLDSLESKKVSEQNSESTANSSHSATPLDNLSQGSRASSDTSLNTTEGNATNGVVSSTKSIPSPNYDLPQQVLIEKLIKLQKHSVKKSEKLEFLQEHISQLVAELKKKNKLIHHYLMDEEPGALSNTKSDKVKVEIMKRGGIMASVYGSKPKDETMTLELSLEINRKLQAILEDTLLKNITLKENLNTLGDEVAKLAIQNRQTSGKT